MRSPRSWITGAITPRPTSSKNSIEAFNPKHPTVGTELVGNRQAGRIVAGLADPIAGGESLNHAGLELAVLAKTLLRVEGIDVSRNRSAHGEILSGSVGQASWPVHV